MGWDEESVAQLLMDPFSTITVAKQFIAEHDPAISMEQWIEENTALIADISAEAWLTQLLNALEGNKFTDERVHPFNVVNISPHFAEKHPPIISKDNWIAANSKLMVEELGVKKWLMLFLDILEGDIVSSAEFGPDVPYGYRPVGSLSQRPYKFSQGGKRHAKKRRKR